MKEGAAFCTSCGAKQQQSEKKSEPEGEEGLFWTAKSQVITSRPVVAQIIMVFAISCLLVLAFIFILGVDAGMAAAPFILGIMIFFIVLGLIIAAAIQFFTKGGPDTDFAVTKEGIGYRAGKESKAINRATLAGTAIGGSLAGAGGSLINISREMDFMSWDEMRSITVYPRERSLMFYRRILLFPFVLYCTPENFEAVKGLVRKYAPDVPYKEKRW